MLSCSVKYTTGTYLYGYRLLSLVSEQRVLTCHVNRTGPFITISLVILFVPIRYFYLKNNRFLFLFADFRGTAEQLTCRIVDDSGLDLHCSSCGLGRFFQCPNKEHDLILCTIIITMHL